MRACVVRPVPRPASDVLPSVRPRSADSRSPPAGYPTRRTPPRQCNARWQDLAGIRKTGSRLRRREDDSHAEVRRRCPHPPCVNRCCSRAPTPSAQARRQFARRAADRKPAGTDQPGRDIARACQAARPDLKICDQRQIASPCLLMHRGHERCDSRRSHGRTCQPFYLGKDNWQAIHYSACRALMQQIDTTALLMFLICHHLCATLGLDGRSARDAEGGRVQTGEPALRTVGGMGREPTAEDATRQSVGKMAPRTRIERVTPFLGGRCSIH